MDPRRTSRASKYRKAAFAQCDFTKGKPYFFCLGGSQDEHKRLKTALKRHLKCFKTRKIRVPKLIDFWGFVGPVLERFWDPKQTPKLT